MTTLTHNFSVGSHVTLRGISSKHVGEVIDIGTEKIRVAFESGETLMIRHEDADATLRRFVPPARRPAPPIHSGSIR